MWILNNQIAPQMMVPLIQHLIKSILLKNQGMITVYARMVVPQLVQCKKSHYEYLVESLLDNPYDELKIHSIMKALQECYGCLGITCADIGTPEGVTDSLLSCDDIDLMKPKFAGYQATTDVGEEARIDLDIHQMNILVSASD